MNNTMISVCPGWQDKGKGVKMIEPTFIKQDIQKYYVIDCPDCGQHFCNVKQSYVNNVRGHYFTMDCEYCGYYEFGYFGEDN